MRYFVTIRGTTVPVDVGEGEVRVGDRSVSVDIRGVHGTDVHTLLMDGRSYRVVARRDDGRWVIDVGGCPESAEVIDERTAAIREMIGDSGQSNGVHPLRAPMPGLVVKVEVQERDRVEAGQGLVIIEAMKMENELRADASARVERIHVVHGDAVEKGQLLIDLAPLGDA
ncbi:MAG: hypothetical protein BMS9Abin29_2041 [Gemmatimonadota bacterium]|nr:MAG: hypothetical protein BMS9Abin29_2041 [Gemmatimonadota bacterium]